MSAVLPRQPVEPLARSTAPATQALAMRPAFCIAACLGAGAAAGLLATPDAAYTADADLARLLVGMAAIKACLSLPVLALVAWRLRSPAGAATALAYGLGACAMAVATVMIGRLSHVGAAAALFHLGALTLMITAWRDEMPAGRLARFVRSSRQRADSPGATAPRIA